MNELRPRSSQKNEQGAYQGSHLLSAGPAGMQGMAGGGGKPPLRDPYHRSVAVAEESVKIMQLDGQSSKGKPPGRTESTGKSKVEPNKEDFFLNVNGDAQPNSAHSFGNNFQGSGQQQELSRKHQVSGHSALPINNFNFFMKNSSPGVCSSKRGDQQILVEAGVGCLGTATTGKATLSTQQTRGSGLGVTAAGMGTGLKGYTGVYSQDNRHQNQLADDIKLLTTLRVNLSLGVKGSPNLRECYLMPEQELTRGLRPNPVNLDKVFSQHDAGGFDQWQKVDHLLTLRRCKLNSKQGSTESCCLLTHSLNKGRAQRRAR